MLLVVVVFGGGGPFWWVLGRDLAGWKIGNRRINCCLVWAFRHAWLGEVFLRLENGFCS